MGAPYAVDHQYNWYDPDYHNVYVFATVGYFH